jgi:hypothetical protein
MKVHLLYRDGDLDMKRRPLPNEPALTQDLELDTLVAAMAGGDKFLLEVARKAILPGLTSVEAIRYRQDVLRDCLSNGPIVRDLYKLAVEGLEREKKHWMYFCSDVPSLTLNRAVALRPDMMEVLQQLRSLADAHAGEFVSEGFATFFAMLRKELGEAFVGDVKQHLNRLRFRGGVMMSAGLGQGNKGRDYVLRRPHVDPRSWLERIFAERPLSYTYYIPDRDEAGGRALSELRDRGVALVAKALAQSSDHILSFFDMMRTELAFYIGCMNLQERLSRKGEATCLPDPLPAGERDMSAKGLYDVCLALTMEKRVVGNDVNGAGARLVIITGANTGGKSTFLRSVGLAQVMMQCGMFVPAEALRANLCDGLFTHYKREEDATMKSGKFDEEMARMSDIANDIKQDLMILLNESFAATNEREGAEIARQIVTALLERNVKVCFVTHLYEFAHDAHEKRLGEAVFLRADRRPDGTRTFKLIEAGPLQTSYGEDLYDEIFR